MLLTPELHRAYEDDGEAKLGELCVGELHVKDLQPMNMIHQDISLVEYLDVCQINFLYKILKISHR